MITRSRINDIIAAARLAARVGSDGSMIREVVESVVATSLPRARVDVRDRIRICVCYNNHEEKESAGGSQDNAIRRTGITN